jgi:membrane dipeptidase
MKEEAKGKKLGEIEDMMLESRLRRELGLTRASLSEVVDHIDHIKKIAGVDAIGIGSDFNGVTCTPDGLDDVSKYPNLTRALLERGYTESDITKIYSGNILRVMRGVEAAASK